MLLGDLAYTIPEGIFTDRACVLLPCLGCAASWRRARRIC